MHDKDDEGDGGDDEQTNDPLRGEPVLLLALVEPTMTLMQHVRERMVNMPDAATGAQKNHRRIYAGVEAADPEEASAAMAEHLQHVERVLSKNLPNWRELLVRTDQSEP